MEHSHKVRYSMCPRLWLRLCPAPLCSYTRCEHSSVQPFEFRPSSAIDSDLFLPLMIDFNRALDSILKYRSLSHSSLTIQKVFSFGFLDWASHYRSTFFQNVFPTSRLFSYFQSRRQDRLVVAFSWRYPRTNALLRLLAIYRGWVTETK